MVSVAEPYNPYRGYYYSGGPQKLKTLAICGLWDRPIPPFNDVKSAFYPEAKRFTYCHGGELERIDNHLPKDVLRTTLYRLLEKHAPIGHLAIFCHGWGSGIQFGISNKDLSEFAKVLAINMRGNDAAPALITLYCCSTAMGLAGSVGSDGSFADLLRDQCCISGLRWVRVTAHDRKGHTTYNPYVKFFDGNGSPFGGTGGYWAVSPSSPLFPAWKKRLSGIKKLGGNPDDSLRYILPTLSTAEIQNQIRTNEHEALIMKGLA